MLQYVFWWLYSICVWCIAISSNDILHPSAGSDVFRYVLHWGISKYLCVVSVFFVLVPAITLVLRIAMSIGSVIS